MRTTEGTKVRFHHNGDFSGDVTIVDKETKVELDVPFEDLKALVAKYVRSERISKLDQSDDNTTLGL
jgi:hypothetical protein